MAPELTTDPVLALLEHHAPADPAEARDAARVATLVRQTSAPRARAQFEPGHLTASALVFEPSLRRALLIFHHKLQRWLQPGGHFEPGEQHPLEVARREVLEETGLQADPLAGRSPLLDVDVHQIPARRDEPSHEHFDLRFLLVARGGEAVAGDGAERLRWVEASQLETLGLDPGLRRAFAKVWG